MAGHRYRFAPMRRLFHLPVFLACAMVGCARSEIVPGISDSTFVATMADLRRADALGTDSAAKAAARRRILQQRGLTVKQMDDAAKALAKDPQRLVDVFVAIDKRAVNAVDSASLRDSAARRAKH
jgi:hypothetical protein